MLIPHRTSVKKLARTDCSCQLIIQLDFLPPRSQRSAWRCCSLPVAPRMAPGPRCRTARLIWRRSTRVCKNEACCRPRGVFQYCPVNPKTKSLQLANQQVVQHRQTERAHNHWPKNQVATRRDSPPGTNPSLLYPSLPTINNRTIHD